MSATPPNPPPGRTPTGPNGAPPKMRRPKAADPLVRPKKRPIPRPSATPPSAKPPANGAASLPSRPTPSATPKLPPSALSGAARSTQGISDITVNGFSGPLVSENFVDYPLITTKRAWREGLKHHIAKFASKKDVDPSDEKKFTRPLRLQRRDPRAKAADTPDDNTEGGKKGTMEFGKHMTEAEREDMEAKKAAREKEREENLAQIAPSATTGQKRTTAPKPKTQQVFKAEMTQQEIARARIKYEEALPWHLEDFDNKNTWVGNYEAALSETYAAFIPTGDGRMRMVPIEKWYKFSAKNQFKALTIDEAEKHMAKKVKDPRWFMESQQSQAKKKELEQYAKLNPNKIFTAKAGALTGGEGLEGDDMDFEEDRFADDEEHAPVPDEDEDAKAAEKRIKQDQLKANVFDLKDEKDYDDEEIKERKEKEALKHFGKRVRKALQKREKNFDYSSGSDANPYSDDDESSDDTETERLKEEQQKVEEENNGKEKAKDSEKNSGPSTKATNTPSGRSKHVDALKKSKRPGSPNLSDASGTDTSRKKQKNKQTAPQTASSAAAQPGSRPMSPNPAQQAQRVTDNSKQNQSGQKKRARTGPGAGGSGSDVDGGAASGSDGGTVNKKLKLNLHGVRSPNNGTPRGSRAGSPANPGKMVSGSRASSPEGVRAASTRTSTPGAVGSPTNAPFPTPAEIHAKIPPTGITSGELLKTFRVRIGESRENHRRFISIVKDVSVYGKDKLLRPGTVKE